MQELIACLSPRELELAGSVHVVRPPTLEEALRVMAALEVFVSEADPDVLGDAWAYLRGACETWLPESLIETYFGSDAYPLATLEDVRDLLKAGVVSQSHESNLSAVKSEAETRSWFAVISDYAALYATPVAAVLATSFPLFIAMAGEMLRIQSMRQAEWMIAYASARSGDEKAWNGIMEAAGMKRGGTRSADADRVRAWEASISDEWKEEQRRKARNVRPNGSPYYGGVGKA